MCSKGVIDIGGHCKSREILFLFLTTLNLYSLYLISQTVIYDAYIPLGSMAFYMIYWAVADVQKEKSI